MLSEGASSLRSVPVVALMMPAPISATSTDGVVDERLIRFSCESCSRVLRETRLQVDWEHHIGTAPGLTSQESPAVSAARRVLREEHIAGADHEALTVARLEFQRARESQYELMGRGIVPGEIVAGLCLAK